MSEANLSLTLPSGGVIHCPASRFSLDIPSPECAKNYKLRRRILCHLGRSRPSNSTAILGQFEICTLWHRTFVGVTTHGEMGLLCLVPNEPSFGRLRKES
jgi:hypothetical protein